METLETLTPNNRTKVLAVILRTTRKQALRAKALELVQMEAEAQRRWREKANIG